jgi:hypothetical protein
MRPGLLMDITVKRKLCISQEKSGMRHVLRRKYSARKDGCSGVAFIM